MEYLPKYDKSYALVIGINNYQHLPPLFTAVQGAIDFAKILGTEGFEVTLLCDAEATREAIFDWAENVTKKAQNDDRVLIYFSGHGLTRGTGADERGYLALTNSLQDKWHSALPMDDVLQEFRYLRAKHLLYLLDCCFSGLLLQTKGAINDTLQETGFYLGRKALYAITAGGAELVDDSLGPEGKYSLFTHHLLEWLTSDNIRPPGDIWRARELGNYLEREVARNRKSQHKPNHGQLPGSGGGDFVFRWRSSDESLAAMPRYRKLQSIWAQSEGVNGIAISPDGMRLATASDDETVQVWSLPDGARLDVFDENERGNFINWAHDVAFDSESRLLASAWEDNKIHFYDLETRQSWTIADLPYYPHVLEFLPDKETLLVMSGDRHDPAHRVTLWDYRSGQLKGDYTLNDWKIQDSAVALQGNPWVLQSYSEEHPKARTPNLWICRFNSDYSDFSLEIDLLIDLEDRKFSDQYQYMLGCDSFALSPDGSLLVASVSYHHHFRDAEFSDLMKRYFASTAEEPIEEGKTYKSPQFLKFWKLPEGELLQTPTHLEPSLSPQVFSSDGKLLACKLNGEIVLLETESWMIHQTIPRVGDIENLMFSSNGQYLVGSHPYGRGEVEIWVLEP